MQKLMYCSLLDIYKGEVEASSTPWNVVFNCMIHINN